MICVGRLGPVQNDEADAPPCGGTLTEDLDRFKGGWVMQIMTERWRTHYNTVCPHSNLGGMRPAPEAIQLVS